MSENGGERNTTIPIKNWSKAVIRFLPAKENSSKFVSDSDKDVTSQRECIPVVKNVQDRMVRR